MKIDNIRYGFACNSSSTHSVVIRGKHNERDHDCKYFGWNTFVAASESSKRSYLKSLIHSRLNRIGEQTADIIANSYFPGESITDVDHQSIPVIPRKFGTKEPEYNFFSDMAAYILRDDVVIYGGNDNDDDATPPETNTGWHGAIPKDTSEDTWVARKESDWWILFNKSDGEKISMSFKDEPAPRLFANTPELVDLKITDYCPYSCTYCYQGSTRNGNHAANISTWLHSLNFLGVFEVAIGGGEPTLHPDFKNLLIGNDGDTVVNFTTRNLKWVKENAALINEKCGGFAFSIDSKTDYVKVYAAIKKHDLREKFTFQYVMGSADDKFFVKLIRFCAKNYIKLTLLGYKTTGRGEAAKKSLIQQGTVKQTSNGWIDYIKENARYIAIDTALAKQVPENAFDEIMLRRLEGTHSMYIDGVSGKAGISSYCDESSMIKVPSFANGIRDAFIELQKQV